MICIFASETVSENDIGEKHDVAAQHPELVSRYGRYFQEAKQPLK